VILDPATASVATGVPTRTIQRWVLTGRIIDHGDGQHLAVDAYEVAQLATLRDARKGQRLPYSRTVT
jgi:hypothetical protein